MVYGADVTKDYNRKRTVEKKILVVNLKGLIAKKN
jgi:hypothetical protein